MKINLISIIILASSFASTIISAGEHPYLYKGIRPLGMGGAFTAISNDANALFYNPAGLSYITEKKLSLLSVEVETGQGAYGAFTDALDVDTENKQETADFLRENIGKYSHAAASVFPSYARPHFAFGFFGTAKASFEARNYQSPSLIVDNVNDAGAALGYAHSFLEDDLSIGASVKYVARQSLNKEYTIAAITSDNFEDIISDDTMDGFGTLLDVGIIYRFHEVTLGENSFDFQFGISGNNFVGSDLGDAQDLSEYVSVGFAAITTDWTFGFDYVDLANNIDEDTDPGKRIRIGVEYAFNDLLTFRSGIYQGYLTYGASIGGKYAQMDVLSYAEEVGTYAGQKDDRRYIIRVALGF